MPTELARPVKKFEPTTGPAIGYLGLALCVLVTGAVVTSAPNLVAVRVASGAVLAAVLIWIVLLRPRAAAYEDTLVLRGMVSDTTLPLAAIDAAVVRQMLVVWVGEDRYTCPAIARSTRSMRSRRDPDRAGDVGSADYATFVESRIEDLARSARLDGREGPAVRRRWARLEIGALVLSGLAFGVTMLVL